MFPFRTIGPLADIISYFGRTVFALLLIFAAER